MKTTKGKTLVAVLVLIASAALSYGLHCYQNSGLSTEACTGCSGLGYCSPTGENLLYARKVTCTIECCYDDDDNLVSKNIVECDINPCQFPSPDGCCDHARSQQQAENAIFNAVSCPVIPGAPVLDEPGTG